MTPSTPGNTSGLFYEAAPSTWSNSPYSVWCDNSTELLGVAFDFLSRGAMDGANKTAVMLGVCTSGAANLADAYTVTVNGVVYGDWFLPSIGELNEIWANRALLGLSTNDHWSSTERNATSAWTRAMFSGATQAFAISKNADFQNVIPVRAF
jgi:hypothetical protein